MPQATDLVVENGASTPVDKTFTLITPAAGDGGIARWALKEGTISSVFPVFTASANQSGNASRTLKCKFRLPSSFTDTVTGLTNVSSAAEFNATSSVPLNFPEDLKDDYVAFATNLFRTALVRSMMRDSYGAN